MIRVLHVIGAMGCGGAESMIMNYYRHIDRDKVQFDFVVHTDDEQMHDREIYELGGKIYRTDKYYGWNYSFYRQWWRKFLQEHPEYKIIHGHIGSSAAVYLSEGKKQGRYTIAHSHAAKEVTDTMLHRIVWRMCSYPTRYIADHFFACSENAAVDRFGKQALKSEKFNVLVNAINCEKFAFSQEKSMEIRRKFNLENSFVVGHVGRFSPQKNHARLLDIFSCLHKMIPKSKLLLVGGGILETEIKNKCHVMELDDVVVFAGVHDNVGPFYSAMDIFCFPSLWEGMPVTLVEAQASGLPCVVSDTIADTANMHTGHFNYLSLGSQDRLWAETLINTGENKRRFADIEFVRAAGYDINEAASKLQKFYLSIVTNM